MRIPVVVDQVFEILKDTLRAGEYPWDHRGCKALLEVPNLLDSAFLMALHDLRGDLTYF